MDMDQVRTFLEVVEAGSFIRAADALHVTQSTVSARIKELELRLGQPLFVRRKSGVTLTTAGKRFQPHAATLLHVLQQARQDIALPAEMWRCAPKSARRNRSCAISPMACSTLP